MAATRLPTQSNRPDTVLGWVIIDRQVTGVGLAYYSLIDYLGGTVVLSAILLPISDHCDLVFTLDHNPAVVDLGIPV
jgi:hypothetical protein